MAFHNVHLPVNTILKKYVYKNNQWILKCSSKIRSGALGFLSQRWDVVTLASLKSWEYSNDIFHCRMAHRNIVEHDDTNDKLWKCNCTEVSKTGP